MASYNRAIELNPNYEQAWNNQGFALQELGRLDEAMASYNRAIELNPNYAEAWSNRGVILAEKKYFGEAMTSYNRAIELNPSLAQTWSNQGISLKELGRLSEAMTSCNKAIEVNPNYAEAWSNRGVILAEKKHFDEAISSYNKAIELNPNSAEAWLNLGNSLVELRRIDEAISSYNKALDISPNFDYLLGSLVYNKLLACNWSKINEEIAMLVDNIVLGKKAIQPFSLLPAIDSPWLQFEAAKIFIKDRYPQNFSLPAILKSRHTKIRVGYFSPDFGDHPVALLTSELFELHDKSKFELVAFSFESRKDDPILTRIKNAFNKFINVKDMSDRQVAELARNLEIDIAVDLGGFTKNSRTGIFSYRAAPIQLNYLGYPGTLGAEYFDYIIADQIVIPESSKVHYMEKVVYLPNTFIVDDSKRVPSREGKSRVDFGLPEGKIVFCCFNNSYKFNRKILESWSRILRAVDGSVLWIPENSDLFRSNLLNHFEDLGIATSRIIFAKRLESAQDHLARYRLADLFLDTTPYNAHTTALDALKSGLPVLTLLGESFAGRVAASLLSAIDLPELITHTQELYEALAIELGSNPNKLLGMKVKLQSNRYSSPLFNAQLFTGHLEAAYRQMLERHQSDLVPDDIYIKH